MSGLFVVWKLLKALASVTLGIQFRLFESLFVCISGRIFAPFRSMKLGASCTVSFQSPQCQMSTAKLNEKQIGEIKTLLTDPAAQVKDIAVRAHTGGGLVDMSRHLQKAATNCLVPLATYGKSSADQRRRHAWLR